MEVRERGTKVLVGMPEGGIHNSYYNNIIIMACFDKQDYFGWLPKCLHFQ